MRQGAAAALPALSAVAEPSYSGILSCAAPSRSKHHVVIISELTWSQLFCLETGGDGYFSPAWHETMWQAFAYTYREGVREVGIYSRPIPIKILPLLFSRLLA